MSHIFSQVQISHLEMNLEMNFSILHIIYFLDNDKLYSCGVLQAITDATLLASRAARITSFLNQKQSMSDVSIKSVHEPMEH